MCSTGTTVPLGLIPRAFASCETAAKPKTDAGGRPRHTDFLSTWPSGGACPFQRRPRLELVTTASPRFAICNLCEATSHQSTTDEAEAAPTPRTQGIEALCTAKGCAVDSAP
jgi:hypothetical protein